MNNSLFDKVYGCLLGGVIGDSMGAPAENLSYQEISEKFSWIDDFEGQGTDDSAIKMILCEAIVKNGGYVTADEFAESFLSNKEKYYNLFYIPVRNMFHKIESEIELPVYAGLGNMHSSSSAMSISPMGIINAFDPRQAAVETYDLAGLIHAGVSTFCRDGACAMAAAVAEALNPVSDVESIIKASTAYLHRKSSAVMRESIETIMESARLSEGYEDFREIFYAKYLRDIISDSRETVPCALALFYLSEGEPGIAIPYAANFGRDADTIATMVGSLCGAYVGASGIRTSWIDKAAGAFSASQERLAHDLVAIIAERNRVRREKLSIWDGMTNRG